MEPIYPKTQNNRIVTSRHFVSKVQLNAKRKSDDFLLILLWQPSCNPKLRDTWWMLSAVYAILMPSKERSTLIYADKFNPCIG